MAKHQNIALFVPHQGCPQDCVFCNQARITGQQRESLLTEDRVRETIESHLSTISADDVVEVAFFGGSFTGLPRGYQTMLLETAYHYVREGLIKGIRLSTRPDYIKPFILDYLASYGVTTIELGTQSMLQDVLDKTKRGHTVEHTYQATELIKSHGAFQLGMQLLPGLPGDSLEKSLFSAKETARIKPDFVRIYPTLVIKGTELEWEYALGKYQPLTLEEAVEWVASMYLIFLKAEIPVIRMGLHPSEDLREDGTIISGPFHPAFRQLVDGALFDKLFAELIPQWRVVGAEPALISIHPADETALRGPKGKRWRQMSRQYNETLSLVLNREIPRGHIQVSSALGQRLYSFTHIGVS